MRLGERISTLFAPSLQSGTVPMRDALGIKSMVGAHGKNGSQSTSSASSVEQASTVLLADLVTDSAPTLASRRGGERVASMTKYASARTVRQSLSLTSTASHEPVHVVAVRPLEKTAEVYNLTVADSPEYFANGVLVHNCDAIRYALARHYGRPELRVVSKQG